MRVRAYVRTCVCHSVSLSVHYISVTMTFLCVLTNIVDDLDLRVISLRSFRFVEKEIVKKTGICVLLLH